MFWQQYIVQWEKGRAKGKNKGVKKREERGIWRHKQKVHDIHLFFNLFSLSRLHTAHSNPLLPFWVGTGILKKGRKEEYGDAKKVQNIYLLFNWFYLSRLHTAHSCPLLPIGQCDPTFPMWGHKIIVVTWGVRTWD